MDFADITPPYEMDGQSWKSAVMGDTESASYFENERCLFFENEKDRAVRCGCFKFLEIYALTSSDSSTYQKGDKFDYNIDLENLFDLCGGTDDYITEPTNNMEAIGLNLNLTYPEIVSSTYFSFQYVKVKSTLNNEFLFSTLYFEENGIL